MSVRRLTEKNNMFMPIYCKKVKAYEKVETRIIKAEEIYINNVNIYEDLNQMKIDIQTIKNDINNIKLLLNDAFEKNI